MIWNRSSIYDRQPRQKGHFHHPFQHYSPDVGKSLVETPHTNYETPFEQLAKPSQPASWPQMEPIQQPQTYGQQWNYYPEDQQSINNHPYDSPYSNYPDGPQQSAPSPLTNPGDQPYQPTAGFYGPEQNPTLSHPSQLGDIPQGIMAQFQDENGQVDVQKMMSTVSQLAQTVQQVTPVVKQLSDFIKAFRASG